MTSVVVADDQPLIRMGLAVLVDAEDELELVGQAADGREALDVVRRTRPDVAVLDIRMPLLDGIAVLDQITADPDLAGTRMIMLTTFGLDEYVFAALRAGASGFLLKDDDTAQLVHAIRTVAAGEGLLSPAVTTRVISSFATPDQTAGGPHPDIGQLTAREREIVAQVATGLSTTRSPTTSCSARPPCAPTSDTRCSNSEPAIALSSSSSPINLSWSGRQPDTSGQHGPSHS